MLPRRSQPRSARNARSETLNRGLLLGGILVLWMVGLLARLYDLQIFQYGELLARAQRQQQRTVEVAPKRGTIFDRQMHPLAMSLAVDSICAVPAEILDREMVANLLAPVLKLDASDLLGRLNAFRSFCWVKRKVSDEEARRVRALSLKGIYFQTEMKRCYANGELAAHVLGYVGLDDNGLGGLEYGMNEAIRGRPGRVLVTADAHRQTFHSSGWEAQPGKNVILTLDENIQYIAEKALAEALQKWHAGGGTVIVQNPSTGEILALANAPTFNPNEYAKSEPSARLNRAIGWVYEPGSTFKLVTVAAALEEKLTNPQEVINCQFGSIVLAGHVIHDHKPFGGLTVEQVLVKSSDVGAIKLGLRLGEERLHRYICGFGFGSRSEVELPGEERGLLNPPDRWSGISIGEISMGQEVGVTPLQLITAYSAIANGGILFQPRIVHDVFRGTVHDPVPPASGHRVLREATAERMKQMFAEVVEHGTGVPARLSGYTAAGKTGTAQEIDASGRYSRSHYVSSFVGFAPVRRPAVTILVVIDSPVGAIYGAQVAAPAFKSIAEQTLSYLNVPQDNPTPLLQVASSAPLRFPRPKREGRAELLPTASEPPGATTPSVQTVSSRRSSAAADNVTVVLDRGPLISVPDFSGLTVRRVAEECQDLGLELNLHGTGLAAEQNPPAGTQLPARTRIWVRFAR